MPAQLRCSPQRSTMPSRVTGLSFSVLNEAVDEAAEAVFSDGRPRAAIRLYHLARQVLEFRRAAAPMAEMLDRLATELPAPTGDRFRRHFRQQRAHLKHLVDGADALGTLLANALQAYLAEVSVRQNNDMRRISAWAAIWAVPTLLRRHLRHELPVHARARLALRLPPDTGGDGGHLPGAVPRIPALRLAIAGATTAAQARGDQHEHVRPGYAGGTAM